MAGLHFPIITEPEVNNCFSLITKVKNDSIDLSH